MTSTGGPTLTDPKGLGGLIAQDGFDYQLWDALVRIPAWLCNPAFEGLIGEGLEDFEARVFAPHSPRGHVLDRFQAKSGALARSDLVGVLQSFLDYDQHHPGVVRIHTLVTPELPAKLRWIARDSGRVRRARPFYSPFADICEANDKKLKDDLRAEFGDELGSYIADSVEVDLSPVLDRGVAEARFDAALAKAFPELDYSRRAVGSCFASLCDLMSRSRGVMLSRAHLIDEISSHLGLALFSAAGLPVHVRSDRNHADAAAIEIDGSAFSGGATAFPEPSEWKSELLAPMASTAQWARKRNESRIILTGSYRLSTAVALGWSFRSAIGFDIDISTRAGVWATDQHPTTSTTASPWVISSPTGLNDGRLVVSVGVIRDPSAAVRKHLTLVGDQGLLCAYLPQAIPTAIDAQSFVQAIKTAVTRSVAEQHPAGIDLFVAGPAAFAVALGHRWNAFPATRLYEFVSDQHGYVPTLEIG